MQRHFLPHPVIAAFAAIAVALPVRASHTNHSSNTATTQVTAPSQPVEKEIASTKGARLEAQAPATHPYRAIAKTAAHAKKATPDVVKVAATPAGLPPAAKPSLQGRLARLTAYWTDEDYWTSQHMSSTGAHLQKGYCAVDPKLIPYGSVVHIPGMGPYLAVDTGSAVVSRQAALGSAQTPSQRRALVVDLFFENEKEARRFAEHGPAFVAVSWSEPVTAADAPQNPKALPIVAPPKPMHIYELASAPTWDESRLPLNFRTPQL